MELNQLLEKEEISGILTHKNSGEEALKAAGLELKKIAPNGGVVHYQRNLSQLSQNGFYQIVVIDLLWIERYFGKIIRLKSYKRESNNSKQIFLTLRLENKIIVQYGLNSLVGLEPTFSFDFSSKGYNLDFNDQIQAPIRLNSIVQQDDLFKTDIKEWEVEGLNRVWNLFLMDTKGGN